MKAIQTKFLPCTNNRGSRIKAYDEDGNSVTISYPHELSGQAVHEKAAVALCEKMHWDGNLIGGAINKGYVFVFGPSFSTCHNASNRLADLVCAMYHPRDTKARETWPTATWAEIIESELGMIKLPEQDN